MTKTVQTAAGKGTSRPPKTEAPSGDLVVAVGASAGGLDACSRLLDALGDRTDLALILVQHLDPTHESLLVELLADHTPLTVLEALDGTNIAPGHLYVIPPGRTLTLEAGRLHVSMPSEPHGLRLPFDALLHSLAKTYGASATCIVLSGTGADGSLGLVAVHEAGGLVIAQHPDEAAYGGMPESAIATGKVDLVLPLAEMPGAITRGAAGEAPTAVSKPSQTSDDPSRLSALIELVRRKTHYDFTLYKTGTLMRRVERRMAMAKIEAGDIDAYVVRLRDDGEEIDALAKDLMINVTGFFRDPGVFAMLRETIVPELLKDHAADKPLRIWVAGCSSGEEAYSIAIVATEAILAFGGAVKLQVFASDLDADAVTQARDGRYPQGISADVSAGRLERFFERDDGGYRVRADLRGIVVFTVQDVLTDPPFSRIDLISCRNLMIYLGPEAQARVVSLFHFALRPNGILLLGSSETAGDIEGRFEIVSKPERLYRHIGRNRPDDVDIAKRIGKEAAAPSRKASDKPLPRHAALAELCRRAVSDAYAPASVLIDRRQECLFSMGRTERYLKVASGFATQDLVSMVAPELRTRLAAAIRQTGPGQPKVSTAVSRMKRDGEGNVQVRIDVRRLLLDAEELMLVSFVDEPIEAKGKDRPAPVPGSAEVAELERELESTRTELKDALHDLENANEEQRTINEEALSVSEEYQSTNEELLTSKEELQSLNEELTALNSQLQETLERQRTTSNDLQNVLYSTDVATLFLDPELNIRFFTPATKALFRVIPGDIGRPLADLNSLASDTHLSADARAVLAGSAVIEREIETPDGLWFDRRILPYRTHGDAVEGVVITFTDITEDKRTASALEAAKRQAELASIAKSRFLAAASHDLRQPLQSLVLLQGLLAKAVTGESAKSLVARLDQTLGSMSGMLNTLLDIKQIEAGVVRPNFSDFSLEELLGRMETEFAYQARSQKIVLRRVRTSVLVHSDAGLLEQMIRNLISNALKYTRGGEVLFGCRRRGAMIGIEVWDTGLGIAEHELEAIFEEYHQVGNVARERSLGLGLGLPIVRRLADLLALKVRVRSTLGKGSVFAIEVPVSKRKAGVAGKAAHAVAAEKPAASPKTGAILLVEDDPEVRDLLKLLLEAENHLVTAVGDGAEALATISGAASAPDMIITDYNLPGGLNGIQATIRLREAIGKALPVIALTGDISTHALRDIAAHDCIQLNKPVNAAELAHLVDSILAERQVEPSGPEPLSPATTLVPQGGDAQNLVYVVDDDDDVREALRAVLGGDGRAVEAYADGESFLAAYRQGAAACLLLDATLPGLSGIDVLGSLRSRGHQVPTVMITGTGDVPMAVRAMKAGAAEFIEKPVGAASLLAAIERAVEQSRDAGKIVQRRQAAALRIEGLTSRQHEVMDLVLAGHPSKNIAADLGISQRTVENHRAAIMTKTGSKSLPELARLVLVGAPEVPEDQTSNTA